MIRMLEDPFYSPWCISLKSTIVSIKVRGSLDTFLIYFELIDVRMRYRDKSLTLPACAAEGKHLPGRPEFCTLVAFKERIRQLTPDDWEQECNATKLPMRAHRSP